MKKFWTLYIMLMIISGCEKPNTDWMVSTRQMKVPVLKSNEINPVLLIKAVNKNNIRELIVKSIKISLSGTDDLHDIDSVEILCLGKDSILKKDVKPKLFSAAMPANNEITFNGSSDSLFSSAFLAVSLKLKQNANLHHKIFIRCTKLEFEDHTYSIPSAPSNPVGHRIGVAVRNHNDDNVHTYRIPGLTTTRKGTLLGIYDVRRESSRDLQGDIDIGVSRSTDGGNTWEQMRIGIDMGKWGNLPEKFNGVSDACILVDEKSDKIFLAGLWMHGVLDSTGTWIEGLTPESKSWNHQWRNKGSQPGFGVKQTSQFLVTTSLDDGKTWSDSVNLTKMCKKEEWWLWAPAPGHGITLDNGTLVFPTQGRDKNGMSFSNITYSTDGGKSWVTSNPAYINTTENMVVQLSGGTLMLNARYNLNRGNSSETNGRVIVTTNDMGTTWKEHPTSRSALVESTCMASIHKHVYHENGVEKSILLFSNPNTKKGRHHMTLKVSFDDGKTWPEKYWKLLDEGNSAGYSCLSSIDENTIGILYEGSQAQMTFESIPLEEILNP
jgi:sialidase-1